MQGLLEAVRKACLPAIWSQGVKLAREEAVSASARSGSEVSLRVRAPGIAVAPTVVLYPDDEEWACDCGGKVDPCAHVAAAIISLTQAKQRGEELPAPQKIDARMSYRFRREGGALALERVVVHPDGREEPLAGSLTTRIARGTSLGTLSPTHADLTIDRIAGSWPRGQLVAGRTAEVMGALSTCEDVRLDGAPVETSGERIVPRAVVEDHKDGVALRLERAPEIDELIGRGVVRIGRTLHALGETSLTGDALEKLPATRIYTRAELGELVTHVLPELTAKIPVTIRTKRLPGSAKQVRPRIVLELDQRGHTLSVLPALVYGDPPQARVDQGRLVHLGGAAPMRDEHAEKMLLQRLRDELHLVTGRRVDFDGKDAIAFAARLRTWRGGDDDADDRKMFGERPLVPRLAIEGDAFDLTFEADGEDDGDEGGGGDRPPRKRANAEAVIRAWQDGLGLAPLEGGGWAPLPEDWLAKFGHRVADLIAAREADGTVPPIALPALADLCDALERPRPPGFERLAPLFEGFDAIPEAPLPEGLTATLRHYQRDGVSWLSFLRDAGLGAVLADDMGLGKTLQTLATLRGRTLVVCPKSVVFNWADEITRFRPTLATSIYHGPKRAIDKAADVTLTTYSMLRLDAEILAREAWDVVVLDEAQAIKNPDSQVARAAYGLNGAFRLALSGTPVENRLEELWSLFHFANRGLLGGRGDFQDRYAAPVSNGNRDAAQRLRRRIRPFLLRRLKRDVAPELPPRTDVVLYVELDDTERQVYDAVRAATRKEIVAKLHEGGSVLAALEALLRLRQAACHPKLVPGQDASSSSKVERLVDALEDAAADGHKALVFSQWTSLLDLVEPHLRAAGIGWERLDGSTRDRGAVVAKFQATDGPPVLLASLKAGGTGLNLTAADHVFLMDPWWNPAAEDQAADRAHRIGQDRPVFVYRMVAKDTVEEGILALQERKRAIADVAVGSADHAGGITRDDLLALLE